MKPLEGKVALVAGSTRGAGRGIACMLGEAGATVYCTGRSVRGDTSGRPETIDDTAEMVAAHGGTGIAVRTDHTDAAQVRRLMERIEAEQGRLDVLVNNANGDDLLDWMTPFWEQDLEKGLRVLERGVNTHIITAHSAIPLMIRSGGGLVAGITDRGGGTFFYDFEKASVMRMAEILAPELRPHGIAAVAVAPGFLRSEAMLEHFGVTEANWRDAVKQDPYFACSETPFYVGRAVAALAADRRVMLKTGQVLSSWVLAEEYGFTDVDGARPHWDRFLASSLDERWEKITKLVRAEFEKHGVDPAAVLQEDREALTLRARLNGGREQWLREELGHAGVIHGSAKRIAADFYERYAQLR